MSIQSMWIHMDTLRWFHNGFTWSRGVGNYRKSWAVVAQSHYILSQWTHARYNFMLGCFSALVINTSFSRLIYDLRIIFVSVNPRTQWKLYFHFESAGASVNKILQNSSATRQTHFLSVSDSDNKDFPRRNWAFHKDNVKANMNNKLLSGQW